MISDCELLGHPRIVDGGCPCGAISPSPPPEPDPPFRVGVWWAGIPRLNFGAPIQTCDHPPIASPR